MKLMTNGLNNFKFRIKTTCTFTQVKNQLFSYNDYTISYAQIASGDNLILAFHGFGMDRFAFEDFHSLLEPHQKLVSVDLFSHGNSEPRDFNGLSKTEWKGMLLAFLTHLGHERFSMMAYSLGGKVVLETVNLFPEKVESLLLFSPDGFKRNRFYEFLSLSALGRWTYRGVIRKPQAFLNFADRLTKYNVLPLRLNKFVHYHVGDKTRREQVYDAHRVYRHFLPDLNALQRVLEKHEISITFIFGEHDRVIHHSLAQRFMERLSNKSLATLHLLNKGHLILEASTASFIKLNNLWFK